jgi:hypothetical protein
MLIERSEFQVVYATIAFEIPSFYETVTKAERSSEYVQFYENINIGGKRTSSRTLQKTRVGSAKVGAKGK